VLSLLSAYCEDGRFKQGRSIQNTLNREGPMGLRDILVFLDETEAAEQRLALAASIAREHGACLSGVFFPANHHRSGEADAPSLSKMAIASFDGATADTEPANPAWQMEEHFRRRAEACGKGGSWLTFDSSDTDALVAAARAADLTIVGQTRPEAQRSPKWRPEDVVIRCGRPVLIVPYIGNYAQIGRRVIVAWDGSREATRALNDALPLIHGASAVTLVHVHVNRRDRDQARIATERMIKHLQRHGIAASTDEITQLGNSTADLLLSRSVDLSADMMIAGASHHSPWREAFFGGTSQGFFRHMTLPILMSH
jgi:nucleotide-binding universal stress UspA family protein